MAQVNPYLNFKGNCREAMNFYKDVFGGNLNLQTVGESQLSEQMQRQSKESILHSTLESNSLVIMGSDQFWGDFLNGNTYHLSLNCESDKEINKLFLKLSEGGKITQPLGTMPWGAMYGSVIDKFGKSWFLNYSKKNV